MTPTEHTDLHTAVYELHHAIETVGLAELPRKAVASLLALSDDVLAAAAGRTDPVAIAHREYAAAIVGFLVEDGREELEQLDHAGRALNLILKIDAHTSSGFDNIT